MSPVHRTLIVCLVMIGMVSASGAFAQATNADATTLVARQGEVSVTLADVDAFAARIPQKDRAAFFSSPQRIEALVTNLLQQKQLAAEARKEGLDRDPAVKLQIDLATEDVLGKARMEQVRKDVKIPNLEQMAKEEYIAHKEKYRTLATLDVMHVLIGTKTRSEEEARQLAEKVDKEAKAAPDRFEELVEKYSDDPTKVANRGLMTAVDSGGYAPEFVAASKALKNIGDVSEPVKTEFGFHVIKLVKRAPAQQRSFDDVKGEILARLRREYVEKYVKNYADGIRNRPMDANADVVASLRTRFGEAETPEEQRAAPKASAVH